MSQADYLAFLARSRARTGSGAGEGVERESELHREVLEACRRKGWIAFHARMDKPTTSGIGDPDFIIIAERGRTILVEAKSKTGKCSPEQLALHAWAKKLGHEVYVIRSLEEFETAVIKELSK